MIAHTKSSVSEQLQVIAQRHVEAIEAFASRTDRMEHQIDVIADWLGDLSAICQMAPQDASDERYEDARELLERVEQFMRLMNQNLDPAFESSDVGRIWTHARRWCSLVERRKLRLTRDEVWDHIEPATPDSLDEVSDNVFEAKWAAPVPVLDIEILRRTEGIQILGDCFEPKHMPNGVGIRFTIAKQRGSLLS
jgi:hypothetical protein